ncbi:MULTISPECIES: acyltransferase family protein [Cupriavidus]|uniref:acyltransferase family protein n=1 Tax=Cupriavidus sp. DF5525 TaxID=3160989 RepID=UPI0003B101BE|nr:hypothetical protein N234_08270 [Ralstonia pickettii DTP0602]
MPAIEPAAPRAPRLTPAAGRAPRAVPAGTAHGGNLPALTSIRFLAALTVVLCHFSQIGLLAVPAWFVAAADGGRPAVSLFFVLSGFVLAYNYRDKLGGNGVRAFYAARVARIWPVLLLSLLPALAVTAWLLHAGDATLLREWYGLARPDLPMLAASLLCQVLALTAWLPFAGLNQPWNGPAWSISCEAFFYALFPALLAWAAARGSLALLRWCALLWLLQGAWIALVDAATPPSRSGFLIAQFPLTHLFEFVLGVCAAQWHARMPLAAAARHRFGIVLTGVSVAILAALAFSSPGRWPAFYLQAPAFGALILGLALLQRPVLGLLHRRWLVVLGEASFSLYLLHVPLGRLAWLAGWPRAYGWLALAAAVALSVLVFRAYEDPMRSWLRRRLAPAVPAPAGAALPASAVRG